MPAQITLIHALRASADPIIAAFRADWPEAVLTHILDDSLSRDRAAGGARAETIAERFLRLTDYALIARPDAILFTCSAFGPEIAACVRAFPQLPILKPNEAMIEDARTLHRPLTLLASFAATLPSMLPEFVESAPDLVVQPVLVEGALAALEAGDGDLHDRLAATAASRVEGVGAIALAQFSLARAAPAIVAATGLPVLTTPGSAVAKLKRLLV